MSKKEIKAAYETMNKAIFAESKKLLKKGLYEASQQKYHYIRALQNLGVWLDIIN